MTESPTIRFRAVIPGMPLPERAGRDALGMLPVRAARWCDAVTTATGFGWWLSPPTDFDLLFDGERVWWACAEAFEGWLPLEAAQFPHFAAAFDAAAPEAAQGYSPPFLTALPEAGMVQVWTGLLARTAPGWSLWLRAPANMPGVAGAVAFEGVVETDLWAGPLFANFRIARTGEPVSFRRGMPFLQAVPVPQAAYAEPVLDRSETTAGLAALTAEEWEGWMRDVVAPSQEAEHRPGRYAATVRKRRKSGGCPFHALLRLGRGEAVA
ncbi:DUF6065 family protein [Roseomonas sp. OT10]|uniref:DUF6065 family protein n=1 Tax=Roseomonas cutis TaxID=2897332 RepID=UPI001E63ADCD|nr:DUF6065 family protein [Roseomonas sp. OT10]UFN49852.1 DUF6065 family protein [Roseomonas sp. OT10]